MLHYVILIVMLYLALYWSVGTVQYTFCFLLSEEQSINPVFCTFIFGVIDFSLHHLFYITHIFFIFFHIYYILTQYVYALFNYLCILLFTFCFVIVHIHFLCYYFHPYVLFISFVEQYFVNCHIEVSSFSFEYLHSAVSLLLVVYLPVFGLIHYPYTTHYTDCSHHFPPIVIKQLIIDNG